MIRRLLIISLALLPLAAIAQREKEKKEKKKSLKERLLDLIAPEETTDSLLIYRMEADPEDTLEDVPLRKRRNYFFGEKTKRTYTVADAGGRTVIEDFYILPDPVEVDPYVLAIYRHDPDRDQVRATRPRSNMVSRVLHGPYKKLIDDEVVEEGMYFYGTKHQRWVSLTRQNQLVSKQHFHKGWYRDSEITYYDGAGKEKLETVMPIQYGKKEGLFVHFFENGRIAVRGQYQFDKKVGIWEEYHNNPNAIIVKREIQYPPDAFQKDFKPYIRREWDESGEQIYESPKMSKGN